MELRGQDPLDVRDELALHFLERLVTALEGPQLAAQDPLGDHEKTEGGVPGPRKALGLFWPYSSTSMFGRKRLSGS